MTELRIRKWEVWQSYRKDRGQPPWIKVHRQLLRDPQWIQMSDGERGQLVSIWMLAADRNGRIPDDAVLIQKLCFMERAPQLERFIQLGFIEPRRQSDAKATSSVRQVDAPEERRGREETETETTTVHVPRTESFPVSPRKGPDGTYDYPVAFERAWVEYPSRDGSNPKVGAYSAFRARVAKGADPEELVTAAMHYRLDCERREKVGTEFVMQATRFWGRSEPWREYLEPPKPGANGQRGGHWADSL